MSDPAVLAVIPAYNEVERIGRVIQQTLGQAGEVVVVDDGSADETSRVSREAGATVIRHEVNGGKGASIITGLDYFRKSKAEFLILLDADGQHDPVEIPKFVQLARETGAAMVVGSRMQDTKEMPVVRLWTNQFTSWVTGRLARQKVPDSQCGYRLLSRVALNNLKLSTARFETETEMLIQTGRAGYKIAALPIETIYEEGRVSRIHPVRDSIRFMKLAWRYW